MKRIGFADLYISEWHANNYPAWIKEASRTLGYGYEVAFAWAMEDVSPVDGRTTDEWCRDLGVAKCNTLDELCEKSDAVIVLAPSNPEVHLSLAQKVLRFGKPTYIDKTFAPSYETAAEIFDLAEKYHTPCFSTSALRYAKELAELCGAENLLITGGGSNLPEYIIHTVEMATVLLNSSVGRVKAEPFGKQVLIKAETIKGNQLAILYSAPFGFSVTAEFADGNIKKQDICSPFFPRLIEDILRFFESGKAPVERDETLEVMRLRDGILKAVSSPETWINI